MDEINPSDHTSQVESKVLVVFDAKKQSAPGAVHLVSKTKCWLFFMYPQKVKNKSNFLCIHLKMLSGCFKTACDLSHILSFIRYLENWVLILWEVLYLCGWEEQF